MGSRLMFRIPSDNIVSTMVRRGIYPNPVASIVSERYSVRWWVMVIGFYLRQVVKNHGINILITKQAVRKEVSLSSNRENVNQHYFLYFGHDLYIYVCILYIITIIYRLKR